MCTKENTTVDANSSKPLPGKVSCNGEKKDPVKNLLWDNRKQDINNHPPVQNNGSLPGTKKVIRNKNHSKEKERWYRK